MKKTNIDWKNHDFKNEYKSGHVIALVICLFLSGGLMIWFLRWIVLKVGWEAIVAFLIGLMVSCLVRSVYEVFTNNDYNEIDDDNNTTDYLP